MSDTNKQPPYLTLSGIKTHLVFWLGAIIVGLATVALTISSEYSSKLVKQALEQYPLLSFVLTPVLLTFLAWLTLRFFAGSEKSGVPQVKAALQAKPEEDISHLLSPRIIFGKLFLCISGIFSGASVGIGGPSIHIGAALMVYFGRFANFTPHYLEKGLILAGSSAGFAAIFSTPLAGIVFAIEEMGRSLEEKTSGIILTAVIFAGATSLILLGQYVFFDNLTSSLAWGKAWLIIPLCGIFTGFMGGIFSATLIHGGRAVKSLSKLSPLKIAFIAGLMIASINMLSGGSTAGTGYVEAKSYLSEPGQMSVFYPFLRMLSTIATFFVGIPAGIFVPSMSIGAGLGADLALWVPIAPVSAVILLGMVGYFSGMLQSPLTAFVIIMEMTNTHELLLPMMATAFIANGTSKLICPEPLYKALMTTYINTASK